MIELLCKTGDVREDGYIASRNGNREKIKWLSPAAYFRYKVSNALGAARRRALVQGVSFDLDIDFLLEIFPTDNTCPVLGIEFSWGGGYEDRDNSPSLDRIIPKEGYIKGNVIWISNRANQIKSNATPSELRRVADFYTNLLDGV